MTTMIERVARAISESHYPDKDPNGMWLHMIPDALAAIRAMRKATYEMRFSNRMAELGLWPEKAQEVWEAMIDEALNPTDTISPEST